MLLPVSLLFIALFHMVLKETNCFTVNRLSSSTGQNYCAANNFTMTVRLEGCEPRLVQNRYCYGQCVSTFLPGDLRKKMYSSFSCTICVPSVTKTKKIFLDCPHNMEKKRKHRRVKIIEECSCRTAKCTRLV